MVFHSLSWQPIYMYVRTPAEDSIIWTSLYYNRGKTDGLVHTFGPFPLRALGFESRRFVWGKVYLVVNRYKSLVGPVLVPVKLLGERLPTGCEQPCTMWGKTDGLMHTWQHFLRKLWGFEGPCFAWGQLWQVVNCDKNCNGFGSFP